MAKNEQKQPKLSHNLEPEGWRHYAKNEQKQSRQILAKVARLLGIWNKK